MSHQENYNLSSSAIEEMTRNGLKSLPDLVRVILNSVMQAERSKYLQANAYERTEGRREHANGATNPKRSEPSLARSSLPFHRCKKGASILLRWKKA